MPNKTPKFWYREESSKASMVESLLWPFSLVYGAGHRLNLSCQIPVDLSIPVLCVGNAVAGGAGKTPTLIALHKLLVKHKIALSPVFLSRGYGGKEEGPHLVDTASDIAVRVGDEPLLLAKYCNTLVSKNRAKGALFAQNHDYDMVLMDDGYQNITIDKDISILVIDGASGFGNNKLLPSGPLREPIEDAFARTDAIIFIGNDYRNIKIKIPNEVPIFNANIVAKFTGNHSENYVCFCGLARPEKFKKTVTDLNLNIVEFYDFADHRIFSTTELKNLLEIAKKNNALLLTTEKDFVRIPIEFRDKIQTLPIEIIFNEEASLLEFIKGKLKQ